ncbi:MAG: hydrogenase iron-sulfur subunit [Chloroflexi bacterium]|nr:hydrogenase iron-sulfur subunit [Chloroflexota bacterium]
MIRLSQADHTFIEQIMAEPGGENLLTCWSCGTCAATCLVRRFDSSFNPRLTLHQAGLGLRGLVLSSSEIWQCSACDACYPRCPRQIHISEVMGAIRSVAIREGFHSPGPSALVDEQVCSGCAVCTRVCPYEAIDRVALGEHMVAHVNADKCMHCGICMASCPSGAITLDTFSDTELVSRMFADGWLGQPGYLDGGSTIPRILVFVCQWSVRTDAELQRVYNLGSQVRVVNLPCSGRVDPAMILTALNDGADGVLLAGCQEGECHYKRGTLLGRSKVGLLRALLAQAGIAQERLAFVELGAFDRYVLSGLVQKMLHSIESLVAAAVLE